MLVANRGSGMNGSKNGSTQDLSKISNSASYSNKLNSELKQSSLFQQNKVESNNFSSSFNTSSSSKFESNLSSLKNGVEDLSLNKKKQNSSNSGFQKTDFGSYSLLETPKLLSGSKSSTTKTFEEERKLQSSTSEHLNNSGSFTTPKTTYSTTIERSINTGTGYSSLNKPHEARVKGLTNGSSTMPKSSTLNTERRALERRSSLHAKIASAESNSNNNTASKDKGSKLPVATNGNGHHSAASASFSKSSTHDSSYNATTASTVQHQQTSFKSSQQSSSLSSSRAVQESSQSSVSKSFGPSSPKLTSYKGTAEKCKFVGETVRHFNAGKPATFELFAPGAKKGDVDVNIISEYHLLLDTK